FGVGTRVANDKGHETVSGFGAEMFDHRPRPNATRVPTERTKTRNAPNHWRQLILQKRIGRGFEEEEMTAATKGGHNNQTWLLRVAIHRVFRDPVFAHFPVERSG